MYLKKISQEEFDALPVVDGIKKCPGFTDYSNVKSFGECCSFGERCSFGECCSFGERCSFGGCCSFGEWCSFGEGCSFGVWCSFGERCSFGECCSFGVWCSFGECCSFGEGCSCEFGEFEKLITAGGFGSVGRTTYFFLMNDGSIAVRCGCFSGTLEQWEQKVKEHHGDSAIGKAYLLLIPAVKTMFEEDGK